MKIIKNTDSDFIKIDENKLVSSDGIRLTVVGYPDQATTHLTIQNVLELRNYLNMVLGKHNVKQYIK